MKNTLALKTSPLFAAIAVANTAMASTCETLYSVDSLVDGSGSLNDALTAISANCNDTHGPLKIEINESLAGQNIVIPARRYIEYVDLEIAGPETENPVQITLDAIANPPINVSESAKLTLRNLTLDGNTNGTDTFRGAAGIRVDNNTTLTLDNVVMQNFHSQDDGAIYSDGTINITDSIFKNNSSDDPGSIIYSDENNTVTIANSTFENNRTTDGLEGGVIKMDTSTQLNLKNSVFKNNTSEGRAGAIYSKGNMEISESVFEGNEAKREGGALYILHPAIGDVDVDIVDTVFESNTSSNGETGSGGAIYISSTENGSTTVDIHSSLINGNHAHLTGGAIYIADSSAQKAKVTLTNSTISNNTGLTNAGITISGGYADGTKISHSTIVNNNTTGTSGGAAIYGNGLTASSDLEISHTIISGNTGGYAQVCNYNEANYNFSYKNSFVSDDTATSSNCLANTSDTPKLIGSDSNVLDPMLNDLADNGGATKSFYPKFSSPTINAGDANIENAPEKDQRGNDRIMRGVIDIGAVEYGNLAPVFDTSIDDVIITEEETIQFDVSNHISDPEGDSLAYSASGLPTGVSIDSTSGIVSGTPTETGTFEITVTVTDDYNATSQETLTITINAKPTPAPEPEPDEPSNDENDSSSGSGSLGLTILTGLLLLFRRRK